VSKGTNCGDPRLVADRAIVQHALIVCGTSSSHPLLVLCIDAVACRVIVIVIANQDSTSSRCANSQTRPAQNW
jgi:hypothetical protein